ncbi:hypothetical protein GXW82_33020 [Streptacidiphilus sp. 4-A2]|nr:hypothetical protein [Streptacidiphilus sp. 4-A2]
MNASRGITGAADRAARALEQLGELSREDAVTDNLTAALEALARPGGVLAALAEVFRQGAEQLVAYDNDAASRAADPMFSAAEAVYRVLIDLVPAAVERARPLTG